MNLNKATTTYWFQVNKAKPKFGWKIIIFTRCWQNKKSCIARFWWC